MYPQHQECLLFFVVGKLVIVLCIKSFNVNSGKPGLWCKIVRDPVLKLSITVDIGHPIFLILGQCEKSILYFFISFCNRNLNYIAITQTLNNKIVNTKSFKYSTLKVTNKSFINHTV
ncbi:hypothetical protein V1477_002703 [Vespula maculifrons]|uniref:Uncharacterized protein n=1 Tax=Vespula maculifrons TaxID=7453 RepID=A0ABD2CVD2_VESMC